MNWLTWGFWWLNVVISTYCVLYWARRRYPNGTHALVMPAGQIWAWQLIFSFVVLGAGISPWNLLWLGIVSIALSIVIYRIYHRVEMKRRIEGKVASPVLRMSRMQVTAANLLSDELKRNAFVSFMRDYPSLATEFDAAWGRTFGAECPLSVWRLTLMLNEIAETLANMGDFMAANTGIYCSSLFIKSNPLTWSSSAVVAYTSEDKISMKWASKVLGYRVTQKTPIELQEQLSSPEGNELLSAAREKMLSIQINEQLGKMEDWRDTSVIVDQPGVSEHYFDL